MDIRNLKVPMLVSDIVTGKLDKHHPLPHLTAEEGEALRDLLFFEISCLRDFGEKEGSPKELILAARIHESDAHDNQDGGPGSSTGRGTEAMTMSSEEVYSPSHLIFQDRTGIRTIFRLANLSDAKVLNMYGCLAAQVRARNIMVPSEAPLSSQRPSTAFMAPATTSSLPVTQMSTSIKSSSALQAQHPFEIPTLIKAIGNSIPIPTELRRTIPPSATPNLKITEPINGSKTTQDPATIEVSSITLPSPDKSQIEGSDFEFLAFTRFHLTIIVVMFATLWICIPNHDWYVSTTDKHQNAKRF